MSVFETTGTSDPFGLWDETSPAVSFGLGDENPNAPDAAVPVYRVNLPENAEAANSALAENDSSFELLNAALDDIPARLDEFVRRVQSQPKADSGVSFAANLEAPESGPEGELLALLAETESVARSGSGAEGVSFGLNEQGSAAFGEAQRRFEAFLEQLNHEILHFAWVETKIANQFIAQTEITWSGDAESLWARELSATQIALHQHTLQLATQTRQIKLRLFLTVASGAAKVAALSSAGTPVLAMPALYKYVTTILAQVKQLQAVQTN